MINLLFDFSLPCEWISAAEKHQWKEEWCNHVQPEFPNFPWRPETLIYRFSSTAYCPNASSEKQHYCLPSNSNAKERKITPWKPQRPQRKWNLNQLPQHKQRPQTEQHYLPCNVFFISLIISSCKGFGPSSFVKRATLPSGGQDRTQMWISGLQQENVQGVKRVPDGWGTGRKLAQAATPQRFQRRRGASPNCRPPHRTRGRGRIASVPILQLEGGREREVGRCGKASGWWRSFSALDRRKTRFRFLITSQSATLDKFVEQSV
jgi:hypothetical protein